MTYIGTGTVGTVETANAPGQLPSFETTPSVITGPGSSTANGIVTWNGTGSSALFSPPTPIVSNSGIMQNSNQPSFLATLTSVVSNAWGSGGDFAIICNNIVFNIGSGYSASTGIFTAPVAGTYLFSALITAGNVGNLTATIIKFVVNAIPYAVNQAEFETNLMGGLLYTNGWLMIKMTVGQTCILELGGNNVASTKTSSFYGAVGNPIYTYFSGELLA